MCVCVFVSVLQNAVEVTGTFKQMKLRLVKEGFDPACMQDPLFVLEERESSYIPLTAQDYLSIVSGKFKL